MAIIKRITKAQAISAEKLFRKKKAKKRTNAYQSTKRKR